MDRFNKLINSTAWKEKIKNISIAEQDREFCRHHIEHFLDVARLMYIENLENKMGYDKELIYTIAFLHDIGRADEYENGKSHDIASCEFAKNTLKDFGYDDLEVKMIVNAILYHRLNKDQSVKIIDNYDIENMNKDKESDLSNLLKLADKKSRLCFACEAIDECYWDKSLKNFSIST